MIVQGNPAVAPPRVRPNNESAGYLGYYTRAHLPVVFDLVDVDGTSPVVWLYFKSASHTLRFIEEKPHGQELHPSQERALRYLTTLPGCSVYSLYDAQRLSIPQFPIRVVRLSGQPVTDRSRDMSRDEFNEWMTNGIVAPMLTAWKRLVALTEMPFDPPSDLPAGADWTAIDKALMALARAMDRKENT